MLEGSDIATISDGPARFTGMTRCFSATSLGTSLMISGSMSKSLRLIAGTPYCRDKKSVSLDSSIAPVLISVLPIRVPFFCCSSCAFLSCWIEIRFSRTSNSPRRPDIAFVASATKSAYQKQLESWGVGKTIRCLELLEILPSMEKWCQGTHRNADVCRHLGFIYMYYGDARAIALRADSKSRPICAVSSATEPKRCSERSRSTN